MGPLLLLRGALLCLALTFTSAAAQDAGPIRTMMEESGMVEQFSDYGEMFRAQVMQAGQADNQIPADLLPRFADIAGEAMNGQRLLRDIEGSLAETLSPDDAAAMTAFYRTALGERIKAAEVAASTVSADAQQRAAAARAKLAGDPERMNLYRRMDDALYASELSTTIVMGLIEAIAVGGIQSQTQGAGQEMIAALQARLSGMRNQLLAQMREDVMANHALTYKEIPIGDLTEYGAFLETDAARANYAAFHEALTAAMELRGREIGERFAALLMQKRI